MNYGELQKLNYREKQKEFIEWACQNRFAVIRLHNITRRGTCSCGKVSCSSQGKHPLRNKWTSVQTEPLSDALERVKATYNVGLRTGGGLMVLDVDDKDGRDGTLTLTKLVEDNGELPETVTVSTPSGGYHLYFRVSEPVGCSVDLLGRGLDVRGEGGFVVAPPSKAMNGEWAFRSDVRDVAPAPFWLIDLATRSAPAPKGKPGAKIASGGRNVHLTSLAGSLHGRLGHDALKEALLNENRMRCFPPLPDDEVIRIAESARRNFAPRGEPWRDLLAKDANGDPLPTTANLTTVLTCHDAWEDVIGLNLFSGVPWYRRRPPNGPLYNGWDHYRKDEDTSPIDLDVAYVFVSSWMAEHMNMRTMPKLSVIDGIIGAAKANAFDPLEEWMESLVWDGTSRIASFFTHYFSASGPEDYLVEVGEKFIRSMVARAMEPGCKVDTMVVIEGKQGTGKSQACSVLGGPFFASGDIEERGMEERIQGLWLYEVSELSGMRRFGNNRLKGFISRGEDHYRAPYARSSVTRPRRCVFIGTTNDATYLKDDDNRRFWPITSGDVRLDELRADRDQIFAEGIAQYRAGLPWWFTVEESKKHEPIKAARIEVDPLDDELLELLLVHYRANRGKVNNTTIRGWFPKYGSTDSGFWRRVSKSMTRLGWERHTDGKARGYVPMDGWRRIARSHGL